MAGVCRACGKHQRQPGRVHCYQCDKQTAVSMSGVGGPTCKHCGQKVGIGWTACESCIFDAVTGSCLSGGHSSTKARALARIAVRRERKRHRCTCGPCQHTRVPGRADIPDVMQKPKGLPKLKDVKGTLLFPPDQPNPWEALKKLFQQAQPPFPEPGKVPEYMDDGDDFENEIHYDWDKPALDAMEIGLVTPVYVGNPLSEEVELPAGAVMGADFLLMEDATPRASPDARWKTKEGPILVRAMANDHLLNAIRLIAADGKHAPHYAEALDVGLRVSDHLLIEAYWRGLLTTTRPLRGMFVREPRKWEERDVANVSAWIARVIPQDVEISTLPYALHRSGVWYAPQPEQQELTEAEKPPQPFSHARQGKRKIILED